MCLNQRLKGVTCHQETAGVAAGWQSPWQVPAPLACTQVSFHPSTPKPLRAPLCVVTIGEEQVLQGMFGEQMNELVNVLSSVGFSTITLQLTHQDRTRREASLVQESRTPRAQGPFNANSAAASGKMFWSLSWGRWEGEEDPSPPQSQH